MAAAQAPTLREVRDVGGVACVIGSYGVVLNAMTQAPIAPVVTLRETCIQFGVMLARLLLRERPGARG